MVVGFALLAAWEFVTALGVVTFRRPIYNALSLVGNMLGLAILFLMLNAQFLFAAQLIVYAGAVMVLFVFIIALLNPSSELFLLERRGSEWIWGALFGVVFAALLGVLLFNRSLTGRPGNLTPEAINAIGNVQSTGTALYTKFLFPVEVTSVLLLVAAVGAVYLAMRRIR